jgi:hypothetical protein
MMSVHSFAQAPSRKGRGHIQVQNVEKRAKTVMNYWVSDGNDWSLLQQVALRVFSMSYSSAASERNFSTFGFIHTKLRNSLTDDCVMKLVYIKTNTLQLSDQLSKQHVEDIDNEEEEESFMLLARSKAMK